MTSNEKIDVSIASKFSTFNTVYFGEWIKCRMKFMTSKLMATSEGDAVLMKKNIYFISIF